MIVDRDILTGWVEQVMRSCGIPPAQAGLVAGVLVDANLRGIDTHGVSRVPSYVELLDAGATNKEPSIRIERKGWLLDLQADRALGQIAGSTAAEHAIELARDTGLAICILRDTGHLGALGYFTRLAADAGFLALMMQNGPPVMSLPGATRRAIGNNPISFAAPLEGRPPLVFDMSASEAAFGKIVEAARTGKELQEGWALDANGRPTLDATAALTGMLLPAGGAKGIGLAMLVETFAGALSGTRPAAKANAAGIPYAWGGFLLVINPDFVQDREAFVSHMTSWLATYLAADPSARYPGQKTAEIFKIRERDGVPLDANLVVGLRKVGASKRVLFPE